MLKFISIFLTLSILLNSSFVFAQTVKIEEFVVTIYDRSMRVTSPDLLKNKFSVVIENKSLSRVVGKIQGSSGKVYHIKSIESNGFVKVSIDNKKGERFFFIPMSPPFQEAELITGQKTYEIPPRR